MFPEVSHTQEFVKPERGHNITCCSEFTWFLLPSSCLGKVQVKNHCPAPRHHTVLLAQDMLRGHGFGSRHPRRGLNTITSGLGSWSPGSPSFLSSEVLCLSHTAKRGPVLQERDCPPQVAFGFLPSSRMLSFCRLLPWDPYVSLRGCPPIMSSVTEQMSTSLGIWNMRIPGHGPKALVLCVQEAKSLRCVLLLS